MLRNRYFQGQGTEELFGVSSPELEIDSDGPILVENHNIYIPESPRLLNDQQIIELHSRINPLQLSHRCGIDLYIRCVQIVKFSSETVAHKQSFITHLL